MPAFSSREHAESAPATSLGKIGVAGAGIMGRGIVRACLEAGYEVYLQDVDAVQLEGVCGELASWKNRLQGGVSPAGFASVDLIIESIPENLALKRQWLSEVEPVVAPQAVLATNTSSFPLAWLAGALSRPERLCGLHFCHPVGQRELVEAIHGSSTREHTLHRAESFVNSLRKVAIEVADGPGFVLNRLLSMYLGEALELLIEGFEPPQLDAAAARLGMPLGPLQQLDAFGLDTALAVGRTLWEAFPDRWAPSELLIAVYQLRRRQRRPTAGFYRHGDASSRSAAEPELDPDVIQILQQRRRGRAALTSNEVDRRLWLPLLLEAVRIVEDRLVAEPADVDRILEYGLGMKPGGLRLWDRAATSGIDRLLAWLEPLQPLGGRFVPCPSFVDWCRASWRASRAA